MDERKEISKSAGTPTWGILFSLIGEILVVGQCILFIILFGTIEGPDIVRYVMIPAPVFLILEILIFFVKKYALRPLTHILFPLYLIMGSLSFYVGGGWIIGGVYILIGGVIRYAYSIIGS